MELSKKQKAIVEAQENKILVISAAASGKTTVLVERIKFLLNSGIKPQDIVAITFTNNAAEELKERIGSACEGAFIGTVHGYANYLLLSRGIDTTRCLNKEDFDRLFELVKENPSCIKPVNYLLLDEAQDSTAQQFDFLLNMVNPIHWMLVGDTKQSIYGFANADPQYLNHLAKDSSVTTYNLNENYRNGRSILAYAKSLIRLAGYDYQDNSIAMREEQGRVVDVIYSSSGIAKALKQDGNYNDWFVLTRTNQELDIITRALELEDIPYDTFKRADLSNAELKERMSKNNVKVLTIHSAKGLEAPKVIVIGAKFYNLEEKCISYVAATRARDLLVWTRPPKKSKYDKVKVNNWE